MARRITVVLPEATLQTIDRLARPEQRSRFIKHAVEHYVATAIPRALKARRKRAAIRDGDIDLEISRDWFAVDREQWLKLDYEKCAIRPMAEAR